jgi:hypothetical protein
MVDSVNGAAHARSAAGPGLLDTLRSASDGSTFEAECFRKNVRSYCAFISHICLHGWVHPILCASDTMPSFFMCLGRPSIGRPSLLGEDMLSADFDGTRYF